MVNIGNFYGKPSRHLNQQPWRMRSLPRENVRGVVRGAAARERLLFPSPAKALQRKRCKLFVAAYARRFGKDEFAVKFSVAKISSMPGGNWLPGGYAWFRDHRYKKNV